MLFVPVFFTPPPTDERDSKKRTKERNTNTATSINAHTRSQTTNTTSTMIVVAMAAVSIASHGALTSRSHPSRGRTTTTKTTTSSPTTATAVTSHKPTKPFPFEKTLPITRVNTLSKCTNIDTVDGFPSTFGIYLSPPTSKHKKSSNSNPIKPNYLLSRSYPDPFPLFLIRNDERGMTLHPGGNDTTGSLALVGTDCKTMRLGSTKKGGSTEVELSSKGEFEVHVPTTTAACPCPPKSSNDGDTYVDVKIVTRTSATVKRGRDADDKIDICATNNTSKDNTPNTDNAGAVEFVSEKFTWVPSSHTPEMKALGHVDGLKLIRESSGEMVAALAYVRVSKKKRGKFQVLDGGKGLGEEFWLGAVMSAMAVVEARRRVKMRRKEMWRWKWM